MQEGLATPHHADEYGIVKKSRGMVEKIAAGLCDLEGDCLLGAFGR